MSHAQGRFWEGWMEGVGWVDGWREGAGQKVRKHLPLMYRCVAEYINGQIHGYTERRNTVIHNNNNSLSL